MCLAVYLASSVKLPELGWNEQSPDFYVERLDRLEEEVRRQIPRPLPYLYYVGSFDGCGCGFIRDGEIGDELEKRNSMYRKLAAYLKDALSSDADLILSSCWEGDQGEKPDRTVTLPPSGLLEPGFELKDRKLCVILKKEDD